MRNSRILRMTLAIALGWNSAAWASDFSVAWFTIDGGGGTSSGGGFEVSGTIAQPDAGTASGGSFEVSSGFWAVLSAVPPPPNCDDSLACTLDTFNDVTLTCEHTPDDASCDDGLFCNGAETCDPISGCQSGSDPCVGLCDEAAEACVACLDDTHCDDGDLCNGTESCVAGSCVVDAPLNCDDELFCNGVETCDPVSGCQPGSDPCGGGACDEDTDSCVETCDVWLCNGDANGDGLVDPLDAGFVQARFGGDPCVLGCAADVNCDGLIDPLDSGYVQARFGTCNAPQSCTIGCD